MVVGDLGRVCDLHRDSFPTNVIGRFGPQLLLAYYRTFIDSEAALALMAEVDGESAGYLVGVLDIEEQRALVKRHHRGALMQATVLAFLRHPRLAAGLLRRRAVLALGRRRGVPGSSDPVPGPTAVLSHIAVDPERRARGVGIALTDCFTGAARERGAGRAMLATLEGEAGAGSFYERLGWSRDRTSRTFDGRTIVLYSVMLKGDS